MPTHDLHKFMAQITDEMGSEYDRIFARAAEDPGTAGDEGEENWAQFFKDWLPPSYHVETKGRIIGNDGRMSPQIDVVVLKPAYPKKLLQKKIWLAGGVAAAFECKTTITAAHVAASVKRCTAFKSLYSDRTGTPRKELRSPLIYGLLAHSHSWKSTNSEPIVNIERALKSAQAEVTHPRFEMDVLCVADLATWSSILTSRYDSAWQPPEAQAQIAALFGAVCGPTTGMICSATTSETQDKAFRPVGALLDDVTNRLAWEDSGVRDIADYFRRTNLGGSGSGNMRPWPLSSYSPEVAQKVAAGQITTGVPWDEWSFSGM